MATDNNYEEILEEICDKIKSIDTIKELDILNIKSSMETIEGIVTDTQAKANFDEIKDKLENIATQVDSCNESLLKDLYSDINSLKESSNSVGQHLENLQNIQNLSLTSAQFEEYQRQQLDLALKTNENIFNELVAIKENSKAVDYSANINNLNTQLSNLHTALTSYIEQLAVKISQTPNLEEISAVMSDLGSVQQKSIKQTKLLIKEFQDKFTNFETDFKYKELENQFAKISEIYDSLNIIRVWIEKVGYINQSIENVYARLGESIDFDEVAEKVDIIYDNLGALNHWAQKMDNIDQTMTNTQSKLSSLSNYIEETKNINEIISNLKERFNATFSGAVDFDDISSKMDIVYENMSTLNEWAKKIDTANEKITNVSENMNTLNEWTKKFDTTNEKITDVTENINALNKWANKIDTTNEKLEGVSAKVEQLNITLEDELVASKVDIIYENIGLLNEWVSKIDDLSQKSEELDNKYNLTNDNLNLKIDEITQTLVNASKIIEDVPNIKDKLEDLSGELNVITHSTKDDAESYIYTLLDIESDFLKLHKFLDDKTQTTTKDINSLKEKFAELTDDISSISIRTNKLILSADDANKEFKSYLDTFKNTIQELDNQKQMYNPEHQLSLLDEKINNMFGIIQHNLDATKSLKSAFVFLAEWVDATGSLLNNMTKNINTLMNKENEVAPNTEIESKLTAIDDTISTIKSEDFSELKSTLTGIMMQLNTSLTPDIDSINERIDTVEEEHNERFSEVEELMKSKIEEQEKHISSLEQKIDDMNSKFDKLMDIVSENNNVSEIKDILNYIAAQTAATNEAVTTNQQITKDVFIETKEAITNTKDIMNEAINNTKDIMNKAQETINSTKDLMNEAKETANGTRDVVNGTIDTVKEIANKLSSFDTNINKIVSYIEED